jgi:acetolactate decarboxylase
MMEIDRLCGGAALAVAATACHAPATTLPVLVNASVRAAYLAGVYDGFVTVKELRARGDFGLGAADKNEGEVVALDGAYYRALADGTVRPLAEDEVVPFATVVKFRPDLRLHLTGPLSREQFEARIDAWLPGANRMFALRVHGRFGHVTAGASAAQARPYRPFAEVYPEYRMVTHDALAGTLAGFRTPALLRDITKQGYHFHLLSDDQRAGGHVVDESIEDVEVEAQELRRLEIVMPETAAFHGAELVLDKPPAPPAR